jgi:hypothetical protein
MSSEGTSPVTDTSNGRSRGRGRGRGRGRANRGQGRRLTNGERDGAPHPVSQSAIVQDVPADEPASTPVSASSAPVTQTPAPSATANTSRGQPRRKSNASRGTSGTHPVPDPPKSAAMKEVPPHLAGPGLDADVLVNKVKALATHSTNSSIDSRYVPVMGLDWADEEEDPESLPDLSQWVVPKPGIDQMQSVKEEEPALPERLDVKAVLSGSQEPVANTNTATNATTTEQLGVTEETPHGKKQPSKPKPKRREKREPTEPGGLDQPLTPTQEGNTKRKTLFERIYGQAPPPTSEQAQSTPEPPTSDKDDHPFGVSSEPESRAPHPNHGFRGRGRGRGRGHALHLAHLPFHPANVQRRQQAAAAAPPAEQTATSSSSHHEKPALPPPRSQERPHTRPVINKDALVRIGLSLAGPKPRAGSPRQSSAVPS